MSKERIVNLDEIVEKWAQEEFEKDAEILRDLKTYLKGSKKLTKVPRIDSIRLKRKKETTFDKRNNDDAQEEDDNIPETVNKVVFKSTYNNPTGFDQNHAFKTERVVTVSEKTTMTDGFNLGVNLGIQLGIPRVANATLNINPQLSVSQSAETSKTHTIKWMSDSTLPVPKGTKVIVEVVVKEEEYTGLFETDIDIKGLMEVDFVDPTTKRIVYTCRDYLAKIIKKSEPLAIRKDVSLLGDATAIWTVRGRCHFRYDIEQTVNTRCKTLSQEDLGSND